MAVARTSAARPSRTDGGVKISKVPGRDGAFATAVAVPSAVAKVPLASPLVALATPVGFVACCRT